jgi:ribA/ribD-fused uncharacterized protein
MAAGYPISVSGQAFSSSEALYQSCRFPDYPEIQKDIARLSPMESKKKSREFLDASRADWLGVRVDVMRWCLRMKLAFNWSTFGELLGDTGFMPIVEQSFKDMFWGAKPVNENELEGENVLGRLLMELREEMGRVSIHVGSDSVLTVDAPKIPGFLIFGKPVGRTEVKENK